MNMQSIPSRTRHFRLEIHSRGHGAKAQHGTALGLGISVTDDEASIELFEQAVSAAVALQAIWPDASLRVVDGHGNLMWASAR
jgi:hypothetical protein